MYDIGVIFVGNEKCWFNGVFFVVDIYRIFVVGGIWVEWFVGYFVDNILKLYMKYVEGNYFFFMYK